MYTKVQVRTQHLSARDVPLRRAHRHASLEKPTLDFDIDLPLGLEGTVSDGIRRLARGAHRDCAGRFPHLAERLVIPMADPDLPVTMPTGETVTLQ